MNTSHNGIRYNYHPIECTNIVSMVDKNKKYKKMSSSFMGKINNPNIIYKKNNKIVNYQAVEIFLSSQNHNIEDTAYDGEIVVLHRPVTSDIRLYCCFPFTHSIDVEISTEVDAFLNYESSSTNMFYNENPIFLEMNKYIAKTPSVRDYMTVDKHGERCIVIVFEKVINIQTHSIMKYLKPPFSSDNYHPSTSEIESKLRTSSIIVEGFKLEKPKPISIRKPKPISIPKVKVPKLKPISGLKKTPRQIQKSPMKPTSVQSKRTPKNVFERRESGLEGAGEGGRNYLSLGFDAGLTDLFQNAQLRKEEKRKTPQKGTGVDSDDEVIYKCEYLPVDSDDKVQVLQVPVGSRGYNSLVGDEVSSVFISNTIFICFVLLIFFICPILHGFLKSLVKSSAFLENVKIIQTYLNIDINLFNLILLLLLVLLTMILLVYGLIASDRTAISIAMFIPFFGLVSYVGIIFFKNASSASSSEPSALTIPV